jgi:hypothetical protein
MRIGRVEIFDTGGEIVQVCIFETGADSHSEMGRLLGGGGSPCGKRVSKAVADAEFHLADAHTDTGAGRR